MRSGLIEDDCKIDFALRKNCLNVASLEKLNGAASRDTCPRVTVPSRVEIYKTLMYEKYPRI